MTEQSQGHERSNAEQWRSKPPRVPRIAVPPPQTRQTQFTALAVWIIFVAVIVWFVVR